MNEKILHIAKQVRKWCEAFVDTDGNQKKYNFDYSLCGMCAAASFALHDALKKHGIKSKVINGTFDGDFEHCWIEIEDKIIDITATQFDVAALVHIVNKNNEMYKKYKAYNSYKSFPKGWGDQQPSRQLTQKIFRMGLTLTE